MANNVSRMHLSWLDPSLDPPQSNGNHRQLTALCDALQVCLCCPLPQDTILALLLSAATAGVPATEPSQTNATAARNQVLYMLAPCTFPVLFAKPHDHCKSLH